ncbi:hypothetical protein AB0M80_43575 [Amycolatopsis sp. NPDC051045]|uniref:hypothetical protein n=1 Tax=Amycolatopsis sp. NPDC051045 TaxID=3156922 RepID=UPI003428FA12
MEPKRKKVDNEELAEAVASGVDDLLGREAPDSTEIEDMPIRELVPPGARDSHIVKTAGSTVAAGSLGLAMVAFVFGNGSLSAVVSAASAAAKGSGTVGPYLTFANAFVLTLPLSVCVAAMAWAAFEEKIKSVGAVSGCVVGALIVTYVSGNLGIDGPALSQMETALARAGSHPLQMAGAVVKVYFEYYTVVPFLGGVITGILTGRACFKVHKPVKGLVQ